MMIEPRSYFDLQLFAEEPGDDDGNEEPTGDNKLSDAGSKRVPLAALKDERQKRQEYERQLDRIARMTSMDRDTLLQQLDLLEQQGGNIPQQQPAQPQIPQQPQPPYPSRPMVPQQAMQQNQFMGYRAYDMARRASLETEIQNLKNNPFYADIEDNQEDVMEHALDNGLNARTAYLQLFGEDRAEQVVQDAEKQARKNANKRSGFRSESDRGTVEPARLGLTEEELDYAEQAGYDPQTYAAMKELTNLKDYRAALEQSQSKSED